MADRPKARGIGGLRAQVQRGPRADGRWYWRLVREEDGRRERVGCGWWTPDEAERALARAVADGRKLPSLDADGCRTVADVLELYGGEVARLRDLGQRAARTVIEADRAHRRLLPRFGSRPLSTVTTADLREHALSRIASGTAASTAMMEVGHLRAAWRWALRERLVVLPVPDLPDVRVEPYERPHVPTADEVDAVLRWLREHPGKGANPTQGRKARARCADVLDVQRLYGCRIEEVAHLRGRDVTPDAVRFTGSEGGKTGSRVLPMVDGARAMLLARRTDDPDAWLFGYPETVMRYVWRYLRDAQEALLQPRWTPHALRAAWTDEADADGVTPTQAAAWLGNSAGTILRHYRRVRPAELRRVAVARGLTGPTDPKSDPNPG